MAKPRVLARDQIRIVADVLNVPTPLVRQTMQRLKTDGRLPATRPVATDVTPRALARLVLGLCAPIPSKSTEIETTLGALPRVGGDGAETVAAELENLIAEAAGITDGDIDFCAGDLLVGVSQPVVGVSITTFDGSSTFRSYRTLSEKDEGMRHFVRLPLQSLRMLSLELIGD